MTIITDNCRRWSIAGDKRITGLCSMEMLMETARTMRDGCPICLSPGFPPIEETLCSPVLLPVPSGTYVLSVKTPLSVTFNYPAMANWVPAGSYVNFHLGQRSGWPTNLITYAVGPGYTFLWDFDLATVWINPLITSVNPVLSSGGVIVPGTTTTESGKSICRWTQQTTLNTPVQLTERPSTATPTVDSFPHPSHYITRVIQSDFLRMAQTVEYSVRSPFGTPPDWTGPTVEHRIDVVFSIEHRSLISTLKNHLFYKTRNGAPPWDYPGAELATPGQFVNPPSALTARRYRFSTTDRTAFMSQTNFRLDEVAPTTGRILFSTPHLTTTVAAYDYVESLTRRQASFAGWQCDTSSSEGPWNDKFSQSGGFSTGWPASIFVKRSRVA